MTTVRDRTRKFFLSNSVKSSRIHRESCRFSYRIGVLMEQRYTDENGHEVRYIIGSRSLRDSISYDQRNGRNEKKNFLTYTFP